MEFSFSDVWKKSATSILSLMFGSRSRANFAYHSKVHGDRLFTVGDTLTGEGVSIGVSAGIVQWASRSKDAKDRRQQNRNPCLWAIASISSWDLWLLVLRQLWTFKRHCLEDSILCTNSQCISNDPKSCQGKPTWTTIDPLNAVFYRWH